MLVRNWFYLPSNTRIVRMLYEQNVQKVMWILDVVSIDSVVGTIYVKQQIGTVIAVIILIYF